MHSPSSASGQNKRRLALVLTFTALYLAAEVVGGLLTHSLALLADAGHMLTDVGGLAMALVAISIAERPATPQRTYGFYRVEILAALINGVVLIGISLYILFEAYQRFLDPPTVASSPMLAIAAVGLVINLAGVFLLRAHSQKSLNLKGAYFEVLSDALSSIAVIAASIIMMTTGWYYADPILSAGIGLFILPRTWSLLRDTVGVLLEGIPYDVDVAALRTAMEKIPGILGVHDLHVWSLTSGVNAMSVHVVVENTCPVSQALQAAQTVARQFNVAHATIQMEPPGFEENETHL